MSRASLARAVRAGLAADVAHVAAVNATAAQAAREHAAAARAAEAQRRRLTAADLAGATHVRDRWGWHLVLRVNATTVTVPDGPDTERIPIARIKEYRP